jgi:hypothetical protein
MKNTSDKKTEIECEFLFIVNTGQANTIGYWRDNTIRKKLYDDYDNETNEDRSSRFEYYDDYLKKTSNKIIITDLVQLLWVGTDEERQEAMKELKDRTGQSLTTAPEWMAWWRANYEKL